MKKKPKLIILLSIKKKPNQQKLRRQKMKEKSEAKYFSDVERKTEWFEQL